MSCIYIYIFTYTLLLFTNSPVLWQKRVPFIDQCFKPGNWSNWSQCTFPFQGDRMAGMHELCNVAVTLPVKWSGVFWIWLLKPLWVPYSSPSGVTGLPQVHQRLAKRPWGLSKVLVPTIGRHWLRWGFFMFFFIKVGFWIPKITSCLQQTFLKKNTKPSPRWVDQPLNKSLVGLYLKKLYIYIHTYYDLLASIRIVPTQEPAWLTK